MIFLSWSIRCLTGEKVLPKMAEVASLIPFESLSNWWGIVINGSAVFLQLFPMQIKQGSQHHSHCPERIFVQRNVTYPSFVSAKRPEFSMKKKRIGI